MFNGKDVADIINLANDLILNHGSWLFPIGLLVATFTMKCVVYREISIENFHKSLIVLPIEIKTVACSFVFAAAVFKPLYSLGIFGIALVGVGLLGISIGFYNYLKIDSVRVIEKGKTNIYLIISFVVSVVMLQFSILVMQPTEVVMILKLSEVAAYG